MFQALHYYRCTERAECRTIEWSANALRLLANDSRAVRGVAAAEAVAPLAGDVVVVFFAVASCRDSRWAEKLAAAT